MINNYKDVALILLGPGRVGKTFLKLINENQKRLQSNGLNFFVVAVVNSKTIYFNACGIEYNNNFTCNKSYSLDYKTLIDLTKTLNHKLIIIVDCTSSGDVVTEYKNFFSNGLHVVAANKLANVLPYNEYLELNNQITMSDTSFRYSTNVGAGLPIISTMQDLVMRGEKIIAIESILSGSLAYVFNEFQLGASFTSVVEKAQSLGLTEPNYFDDLSGKDVARKLLILVRIAGYKYDLEDIDLHPVIASIDDIETLDKLMKRRLDMAAKNDKVLRYTASLVNGRCAIGLNECLKTSTYNQCYGADNFVAIYTETYSDTPIIIQGKGAGLHVTAYGLLSDVIKVSSDNYSF